MFKEFREFALKGSMVDMAVGVIIGAGYGTIVKSMVDDILMPTLSVLLGRVDFSNLYFIIKEGIKVAAPYASLADAKIAGAVTLNYGLFINNIVTFLIVALSGFVLVRGMNRLRSKTPATATQKECPYCLMSLSIKATRCPHCTSNV